MPLWAEYPTTTNWPYKRAFIDGSLDWIPEMTEKLLENSDGEAPQEEVNEFLKVFFDPEEGAEVMVADDEPEWIEMEAAADSGAGDNVASTVDVPGYEVEPSEGSRRGQNFVGAGNERIRNEGEVHLQMAAPTDDDEIFNPVNATFQIAKVCRPLMSVSRICDRGECTVTFDSKKGVVRNKKGQIIMVFHRKGNLYVGKMKVRNPRHKGFRGQGS